MWRFLVVALIAGCPAATVATDGGVDAGTGDAGRDSGAIAHDAGADANTDAGQDSGVDSGPVCACSGVSMCCPDGCNPAAVTTECSSVDGPQDCYPDSYIAPGWRGYDETVTHCGPTGACDGTVEVVNHRWSCPDGCVRRVADMQANCL